MFIFVFVFSDIQIIYIITDFIFYIHCIISIFKKIRQIVNIYSPSAHSVN